MKLHFNHNHHYSNKFWCGNFLSNLFSIKFTKWLNFCFLSYLQEKEELEKQLSQYKEDIDVSENHYFFFFIIILHVITSFSSKLSLNMWNTIINVIFLMFFILQKVQELKSDNIRLKDENGALIRVISKLSRTPASSSSWAVQWALMGVRHDYIFKIKKERFYSLFIELLLKLMMWAAEVEFFYTLLCLVGTSELVVSQGLR